MHHITELVHGQGIISSLTDIADVIILEIGFAILAIDGELVFYSLRLAG